MHGFFAEPPSERDCEAVNWDGLPSLTARGGGTGLCILISMIPDWYPVRTGPVLGRRSRPRRGPWRPSPGADKGPDTLPAAYELLVPGHFSLRPSTRDQH